MAKYVGFKIGKVHESHVISEYYCGGCGYPVTDHDSFCPECGGAFCKCDADDLESENAKLRELLADTLMDTRDYCAKYGLDYDGLGWNSANDDIDRRLRELGVTDD